MNAQVDEANALAETQKRLKESQQRLNEAYTTNSNLRYDLLQKTIEIQNLRQDLKQERKSKDIIQTDLHK